jgi:hypothetical protein
MLCIRSLEEATRQEKATCTLDRATKRQQLLGNTDAAGDYRKEKKRNSGAALGVSRN